MSQRRELERLPDEAHETRVGRGELGSGGLGGAASSGVTSEPPGAGAQPACVLQTPTASPAPPTPGAPLYGRRATPSLARPPAATFAHPRRCSHINFSSKCVLRTRTKTIFSDIDLHCCVQKFICIYSGKI